MLKILHVHLSADISGAQRVSLDEMSTLGNKYKQDMICGNHGSFSKAASSLNVKPIVVEELVREISAAKDIKALFKLYKIIKSNNYDIVHTHSSKSGFLGRIAAKIAGVKMIVHTVHGFAFPSSKNKIVKLIYFIMEWIASYCSNYIIVMNESDKYLAEKYFSHRNNNIILLNNAVDINIFKPRNRLKNEKEAFKIIMVGRLCEQKNPLLLIEAAKFLTDEYQIDIVGDGPLFYEAENLILNNKFNCKIQLLGWSDAISEMLPNYDLLVLPSRWEGMPLVLLEAMAVKLPVLCSNISSNKYLVNQLDGFLFEDNNVTDLVKKITYINNNPKTVEQKIANAYEVLVNNFELNKRTEQLKIIYSSEMK